jgi:uncharacterized protein
MYPGYFCRHCHAPGLEWVDVTGRGVVYSFTVQHRRIEGRTEADTILAIVELEEGPRLFTNLVGISPNEVSIGMDVVVDFQRDKDDVLPMFRPHSV